MARPATGNRKQTFQVMLTQEQIKKLLKKAKTHVRSEAIRKAVDEFIK